MLNEHNQITENVLKPQLHEKKQKTVYNNKALHIPVETSVTAQFFPLDPTFPCRRHG